MATEKPKTKAKPKKAPARKTKKTAKKTPKKTIKKATAKPKPTAQKAGKSGSLFATLGIVLIILVIVVLAVFEFMNQPEPEADIVDMTPTNQETDTRSVRSATLAGSFYPEGSKLLREQVAGYVVGAEQKAVGETQAVLVPHAGIQYSGPVAGFGYKAIADGDYKRAIILGPAHNVLFDGVAVSSYEAWRTPLGEVTLADANQELPESEVFVENDNAFVAENSIEVQIPFLQQLWPEIEIIPLAVGQMTEETRALAADRINELLDDETILIISSDLSHYLTAEECVEIDEETLELIIEGEQEDMLEIDACGREPILIANLIANEREWTRTLLAYQHTGDVTGDDSRVIGYPAVGYSVVSEDTEGSDPASGGITSQQENYLLDLARTTIEQYINEGTVYEPEVPEDEFLTAVTGAFVTLNIEEELRGCIGHTVAQEALYLAVRDNAIAAATQDARFDAVTAEELNEIDIEVSVLTAPETTSLYSINPGTDGVILTVNSNSATFLPQVWEDMATAVEFMEALSVKVGLNADAWLESNTTFERYQVTAFSE